MAYLLPHVLIPWFAHIVTYLYHLWMFVLSNVMISNLMISLLSHIVYNLLSHFVVSLLSHFDTPVIS